MGGSCCGLSPQPHLQTASLNQIKTILKQEQINILHLIFKDLGDRISDKKINLENFLLFFHKNGFWGERLFKEFDFDETNLISEEEFIYGIAKIFKSTEEKKISLLFKFFSRNRVNGGVFFNEFLIMLYNYPKEDLKEILNDRDFIQLELKKFLVPIRNDSQQFAVQRTESVMLRAKSIPSNGIAGASSKSGMYCLAETDNQQTALPSMIGKDILKNMKDKYKPKETVISLRDGETTYDIRTMNIHQLVKRFAVRIFNEANIDEKTGKLNFDQFFSWIKKHQALYLNYYDGFHNQVWEIDPDTRKPKYLSSAIEKKSDAIEVNEKSKTKVVIYLLHSILVVCNPSTLEKPLQVICLQGLAVKRLFEVEHGFGLQISHRDGVYTSKKFFFKSESILLEWMQLLKYYKGKSVQQQYEIGEKIGTGKFSVVYKCRSNSERKEYAIKVIETFKLDPQARKLIAYECIYDRHESSMMKIVSHPLLLEFKQCIQTKTHIYIVTELVNGCDLFEFVKEYHYLDEDDAAVILQQIIVGVRYLHSFEIVHRDLKPENIMVVVDEETQEVSNIKIIDFGFANYLSALTEKSTEGNQFVIEEILAGTPNYIAPEVLREEKISFKIDTFALGAILYFMLSGTLPFNDYNITEILKRTMSGDYNYKEKRWQAISSPAKDLIDSLLKNKPQERITLEETLKHPWFKCIQDKKDRKIKKTAMKENLMNAIIY